MGLRDDPCPSSDITQDKQRNGHGTKFYGSWEQIEVGR